MGYSDPILMITSILKRDLEITLETALMLVEDGTPLQQLAERIYNAESQLMSQLQRPWMVERLVWMLSRKRQHIVSANQLRLPGFEDLPRRLTMKDGRRVALRNANLEQLKEFRNVLLARRNKRLESLNRLIACVAEYEHKTPGITVGEVISLEIEKRDKQQQ